MTPVDANKTTCTIPPLVSGGVMLSYHCNSACRHCLYRCSPRQPDEWITPDTLASVYSALSHERALDGIHLAGGEPTLRPDLLEQAIRMACEAGIRIDYVETNAQFADDVESARSLLIRLREAGLRCLLVSVSMFHNEFIPFRNTRKCIEAATEVFGPHGVFVYMPHMVELLSRYPDDGTHTLARFCRLVGIRENSPRLVELYSVIPGGRAPQSLRRCYRPRPAGDFRNEHCSHSLLSTTHFHIDPCGRLFTGGCAGICTATAPEYHPAMTADTHPIFHLLCEQGPADLMTMATERHGFQPSSEGYISKCDLCFQVRRCLVESGDYPELQPAHYYA